MILNPTQYQVKLNELKNDPSGHMVLLDKVTEVVKELNRARLIRFNQSTE
jgi:hypothetical protein